MTILEVTGNTWILEVTEPDPEALDFESVVVMEVGIVGLRGPQGVPGESDSTIADNLAAHLIDPTPHPAYDDIPSLTVIFENALL